MVLFRQKKSRNFWLNNLQYLLLWKVYVLILYIVCAAESFVKWATKWRDEEVELGEIWGW